MTEAKNNSKEGQLTLQEMDCDDLVLLNRIREISDPRDRLRMIIAALDNLGGDSNSILRATLIGMQVACSPECFVENSSH